MTNSAYAHASRHARSHGGLAGIGIGTASLPCSSTRVSMHMMEYGRRGGKSRYVLDVQLLRPRNLAALMGVVFVLFAITHITPFSLIVECTEPLYF